MDETTKVYWLLQCLKHTPGFAYRPNGLFEYWGVPLDEIPVSVFETAPYSDDDGYLGTWLERAEKWGITQADQMRLVSRVDQFLAERHVKAVA